MKKYYILILIFIISTSTSYATGDFFRFDYAGGNNQWQSNINDDINSNIYSNNQRDTWTNPYVDTMYNNPLSKIFNFKNSILPNGENTNNYYQQDDKYAKNNIQDSDMEYLLSRMEKTRFGTTYNNLDIDNRLDRLDSQIFGTIQSGNYKTRLNRLKHAFAAETTRDYKAKKQRLNSFKQMFSSGLPTSIPANNDYYSSLY